MNNRWSENVPKRAKFQKISCADSALRALLQSPPGIISYSRRKFPSNLRSPALLGVYPALVWREYFSQKKLATPSSVFRLDCLESQFKEIKICLQERKVVVVHEVALSPPPVVAASQSDATIHLVSLSLFYKSANKRTKSIEKNRHMTKLWYM